MNAAAELTFAGQTLPVAVWARRAELPVAELVERLAAGWAVQEALSVPAGGLRPADRGKPATAAVPTRRKPPTHLYLVVDGVRMTLADAARAHRIKADTLRGRIFRYGWTVERALQTPVYTAPPSQPELSS